MRFRFLEYDVFFFGTAISNVSNNPLTRRLASGPIKRSTHEIVGVEGLKISLLGEAVEIEPMLVNRGKMLFIRLHTDDRMIELDAAIMLNNHSRPSAYFVFLF